MNVTGIILAGGKSRRFHFDKTMLKLDNQLIVANLVNLSHELFSEVLIVSNETNKFNLPNTKEISDEFVNMGPMAGIHAGLKAASNPYAFVIACDMPFANQEIIRLMLSKRFGYDAVLACTGQYMEPLFGVYQKKLYLPMGEMLANNDRCILDLYPRLNICYVEQQEWQKVVAKENPFFNINYMEDYLNLLNGKSNSKKQTKRKRYYLSFCNSDKGDKAYAEK